ncbi:similar to Saccharomyces cerevisiae YKL016C ATP7 Subunit d of the stator stalk of mitochondrial F1F0 ATP synthase [Maudiozyma barnettii]|uniref:ATP synthase subunit d, mitochondrial n=1 Tax=Maudiozyma barnettii TaxID=61262 RepID=A0A8H2ZI40_9SACH|nr:F1F0 ATP synthase subunit d [Kazachstania barnettii]CAB4256464.1 similar to Saccharomyces cerevisiae YKL016C ATP7 Subunit d of the stator stalk of mitochondrial F1F0 ATP synthase [Kazachstania barnettii]CAD1785073.1 similar to Saccharomyces cerevisiae YKL016C ATP7 Subunit d of the stator stalk of mitochondrial F1F0 ATP synthase [Kazachstania barnettii]
MSLAKSAANKLDWAKVITSLKITGKTATELSSFKKRNDEARRQLLELQQQPATIEFDQYRSLLKNQAVIDQIERFCKAYTPVTIDSSKQIHTIESFQQHALANAEATEKLVNSELATLKETLQNIENARPFDELTVDDLVKAKPEIDAKVEEMVKRGKWEVPGYAEKFGGLNVM